jgi:hypothetical protein
VKRTSVVAAALVLAATGARAQDTQPPQPPQPATTAPSADAAQAAPGAAAPGPNLQRIYHIRQLEGMLTNAVKAGAASLASQLKIGEPNSLFVTGNARTRGFELDGYGVFFDVDVPTMMQSVLWSTQMLQQQQYVDFLRRQLSDPTLDDKTRRMADFEMRRVVRAMNNGQVVPIPNPQAPQAVSQGLVRAADDSSAAAPLAPVAAPPDPRSPDELYTETIKGALIDAMLSYAASALQLRDDEWLTIAARATSQGAPGQLDDSSSIVIRAKGSDLSDFLKGKITRDAVVKKIEIKEG